MKASSGKRTCERKHDKEDNHKLAKGERERYRNKKKTSLTGVPMKGFVRLIE